MSSKREERKQRSEQQRDLAERRRSTQVRNRRVLIAVTVMAVAALLYAARSRERPAGKVWSAEHGHWHDQ
jgi:hypothetical protein